MNTKRLLIMALPVLLLIIGGGVYALTQKNDAAKQSTVAEAQKKRKSNAPKCAAANTGLQVSAEDRAGIEMAAVTQLLDVPAGTETVVNVATYDGSDATGSELYPKDYGTYNFTAEKDGSADSGQQWKITKWTPCESV
jgi:hypothetical protein